MGAREFVYGLLTSDATLNTLGLGDQSTFLSHDVDTPLVRPMMILRWQNTDPGVGAVNRRVLQVWIHDEKGDYTRIDAALERVRTVLTNVAGANAGAANKWVTQINWNGDSDDLTDDEAGTFTRWGMYTLTGSAV